MPARRGGKTYTGRRGAYIHPKGGDSCWQRPVRVHVHDGRTGRRPWYRGYPLEERVRATPLVPVRSNRRRLGWWCTGDACHPRSKAGMGASGDVYGKDRPLWASACGRQSDPGGAVRPYRFASRQQRPAGGAKHYDTGDSQIIPESSTNPAQCCLASGI